MVRGRNWSTAALATVALVIVGTATAIDARGRRESATAHVSQGEAEERLARAVEYVRNEDATALCALRGSTDPGSWCSQEAFDLADRTIGLPLVVGFREVGSVADDDAHPAGAGLELCVAVDGETIYTEFYVVRTPGDDLVVPHPVYWLPRRIIEPVDNEIVTTAGLTQTPGAESRCAGPG